MDDDFCSLTRRNFLTSLGASIVIAACGGRQVSVWTTDPTSTTLDPSRALPTASVGAVTDRTLVLVEMGGGNDGLNMVVPHANSRYYDLRKSLAIEDPIDLDGEIGLHPSLPKLAARFDRGDVAIVEGVGVEEADLSHFVSMNTWWTAQPESSDGSGWLGRYLDGSVGYSEPLAGISIGPGPSRAMLGHASYIVAIQDSSGLAPSIPPWVDSVDELIGLWEGFAASDPSTIPLEPVRQAIGSAVQARRQLEVALAGTEGPRTRMARLGEDLDLAARLIASDLAPSLIYVHGFGDFDTHQGQENRHGSLMEELDNGLEQFFVTLGESGLSDRVLLATASEFGRRPRDNGSGTDHGTAAPHLLIGSMVKGGRYGEPVDLAQLDSAGNPTHEVDFRSVYATVLDGFLAADADTILGARYERIPLL